MTQKIETSPKWHFFKGYSYGLTQSALQGLISFSLSIEITTIEDAFAQIIDEPVPREIKELDSTDRLAALFAFWVGAVQRQSRIAAGSRLSWTRSGASGTNNVSYRLTIPIFATEPARVAIGWVRDTSNMVLHSSTPESWDTLRKQIHDRLHPFAPESVNSFLILTAAERMRLPALFINKSAVLLGSGRHAHWMDSTITDQTPCISVQIARQKHTTAALLRAAGLPGSVNMLVASEAAAVLAAEKIGYPVVVKPADLDKGVGVSADLRSAAQVREGYGIACAVSQNVLAEKWAPGCTHRLTVFRDQILRVTRRIAGGVTGNGRDTVDKLVIAYQNTEYQNRKYRRLGYHPLQLDAEALSLLQQVGMSPDHIPNLGQYVRLRRRDNINAGGSNEEIQLSRVHPDNASLAIDAARVLRLDFAGVDLIIEDIEQSWLSIGGTICEINAQPQMGASKRPELYEHILAQIMGPRWHIDAHLLICPTAQDAYTLAENHAREYLSDSAEGQFIASRSGIWLNTNRCSSLMETGFNAARAVMLRPDAQSLICLMTPQEIIQFGLPLYFWNTIRIFGSKHFSQEERKNMSQVNEILHGHCNFAIDNAKSTRESSLI